MNLEKGRAFVQSMPETATTETEFATPPTESLQQGGAVVERALALDSCTGDAARHSEIHP